jgi:hypothetical protein
MPELPNPITTTQLFSRAAIGALWERRAEFDDSTRKLLDKIWLRRGKHTVTCSLETTYRVSTNKKRQAALGYGRFYSAGGLEQLEADCRAAICKEFYHDIDMVNAQPTILVQLAKKELGMDMPQLQAYVENRDAVLGHIMERDNVPREEAKQRLISILFGGYTDDYFLVPLYEEVQNVAKKFSHLSQYEDLVDACRKEKPKDYLKSLVAYITQTAERRVLLAMRDYLTSAGWSMDVLIYDGGMIRKRTDAACDDALMTAISTSIKEATGFDVQVKEKPLIGFTDLIEHVAEAEPLINDSYACMELIRLLGDEITKQNGVLYFYTPSTGMWEREAGPLIGLPAVHRFASQLVFKQASKTAKEDKLYDYGGSTKNIRNMLSHLAELIPDSNFINDSVKKSEGFLLFADGIYDMKAHQFTVGFDKSKVFTSRIIRNFPKRDVCAIETVNRALFINPFSEVEVGNWYKNILARALAGHTVDKVFHVLLGEPNTGKSTVTGLLCKTFGGYVKTWTLDNLKYKAGSTTDEAKQLSWIAPLLGARIALSNEARMDGIKLDGNLAKRLSGGDAITLRQNFKDETTQEIMTTFFAMGNDMPSFSPEDAALRVRMNYATFNYSFVPKPEEECGEWEKPADPLLKMKIESDEWKDAFTHIILDAYAAGVRLPAPDSVKAATDEYVPVESNSLKQLLEEEYELAPEMGENDWLPARQIINYLKGTGLALSDTKIGRELSKMGLSRDTKRVAGKVVKIWKGIR